MNLDNKVKIDSSEFRKRDSTTLPIIFTLLAILAVFASLITLITPSTEAVRLRNSFISQIGTAEDFNWTPANVPADFLQERGPVPDSFKAISRSIMSGLPATATNFDKALAIARNLMQAPRVNGGILSNTYDTYQLIVTEGKGYCADFTQVFNGLAIASGVPVREWGMAFDGFGGQGHAFNEIYDTALRKWILIDSFNSFYVKNRRSGIPLSALEFRDLLIRGADDKEAEVVLIVPDKFQFNSAQRAINYYKKGIREFYLTWGNNVFSYDDYPVVRFAGHLSRSLEQGLAILTGVYPTIHIMDGEGSAIYIQRLFHTQVLFIALLVTLAALCVVLLLTVIAYRKKVRTKATYKKLTSDGL